MLDQGPVHSSRIALLGDAAPGDIDEAIAATTFGIGTQATGGTDPWAAQSGLNETFVTAGELLSEAFNDGPAFWNGSRISLIFQAADLSDQVAFETGAQISGPPLGSTASPALYLQDTRDWYAVHGGGSTASCNILMADGSVREFFDGNNDKFLNPGFPVPPPEDSTAGLTEQDYAEIGYRGPERELAPAEMFSGIFLQHLQKRSKFESN
jgi:prepilin-type processing-associated H-X9-DG protein